jgi:hypothetical protein
MVMVTTVNISTTGKIWLQYLQRMSGLVELNGKVWLRLLIFNPVTSQDDLKALLKRNSDIG